MMPVKNISRATWITEWVNENRSRWYDLSAHDKDLCEALANLKRELGEVLCAPSGIRLKEAAHT